MRCQPLLIIVFLVFSLSIVGCKADSPAFSPPPTVDQTKGTLVDTTTKEVMPGEITSACLEYRQNDVNYLKHICDTITDQKQRNQILLKEWHELYGIYQGWSEKGGLKHTSKISVYGPIASAWLNEMTLSLARREVIIANMDKQDSKYLFDESAPPASEINNQYTSYGLQGLTGEAATNWYGQTKEYATSKIDSDSVVVNQITNYLNSCTYPKIQVFRDVEIYCLPAHALIGNGKYVVEADVRARAQVAHRGFTPNAGKQPIRVLTICPNEVSQIGHELGHVWMYKHLDANGLALQNIISTYMGHRYPAAPEPETVPDAWINDDKMLGKIGTDMVIPAWGDSPVENMAEDFVHLYFPDTHPWATKYPNIYNSDKYIAVRKKLQEYFSYIPYETLYTEDIPKFLNGDQLVIKGEGNPNTDVYMVSGGEGYHLNTDSKGTFEMKLTASKESGLHTYKLTLSPTREFNKEYFDLLIFDYVP